MIPKLIFSNKYDVNISFLLKVSYSYDVISHEVIINDVNHRNICWTVASPS